MLLIIATPYYMLLKELVISLILAVRQKFVLLFSLNTQLLFKDNFFASNIEFFLFVIDIVILLTF